MTPEVKVDTQENVTQIAPENTPVQESPQQETVEEINWRKFRAQRAEERKQREAAESYAKKKEEEAQALKAAMEALVNTPNQKMMQSERLETEDELIDKKVQAALRLRELEIEKHRVERERNEFPQKLVNNYKDFNEICTSENLDYLEYHYPEVARGYKHMPDGYDKWEGIYLAVKKFIPNKNSYQEAKKAEKNLNKPVALSKPGMTQTGDNAPILHLDEKRRMDNWKRMQKVMGKGGVG